MSGVGESRPASAGVVAVIGTGVIGRSWMRVFARAGFETRMYDPAPAQRQRALSWLAEDLESDVSDGIVTADEATACIERIVACDTLDAAVAGAGYVQESGPEIPEAKEAIFGGLDASAEPDAILASSTSTLDLSRVTRGIPGASRCITAHPVNPPHLIPAVEVLPGDATTLAVVARTCELLRRVGQTPVLLKRFVPGFLLNRMQAALVREAIHLVASGVADVEAVDAVIRDGPGLRWALMGPFAVANTNADGGIREYYARFGTSYRQLMDTLGPTPDLDAVLIERLARGTDVLNGGETVRAQLRWRDRMLRRLRALKEADPPPGAQFP